MRESPGRQQERLSLFYTDRLIRLWNYCFGQAEDGIPDYKVTGVQTCALPIWLGHSSIVMVIEECPSRSLGRSMGGIAYARSEERRVGKECRSRWSPYQ